MSTFWITVSIIFTVVWSWCIWEAWNAPIKPDDYGTIEFKNKNKNKNKK